MTRLLTLALALAPVVSGQSFSYSFGQSFSYSFDLTVAPTAEPTADSTIAPTAGPTAAPTAGPTAAPTAGPTALPTSPMASPTAEPVATPTSAPTAGPTAAPMASPTAAPTPYVCQDSLTWHKKDDPSKDCAWAANSPERFCDAKGVGSVFGFERCYEACGICGVKVCVDDPNWLANNSEEGDETIKNCDWVGRRGNRFNLLGQDGTRAWESCSKATGACDFFGAAGGVCEDSAAWHKNNDDAKDCAWVAAKADTRCNAKGQGPIYGFEQCTSACGSCGAKCIDSPTWHKKGEEDKRCDWVSRVANRRSVVGEDGTRAWESCLLASRSCEINKNFH